jgi:SAM-dependent methyltransferase
VQTRDLSCPSYLELGFGQGVSLAVHAATTPGTYWGTDFNPAQAASTEEMVRASGSDARVLDESFAELASRADLPGWDMIALHGIWSWVSPENRRVMVEIARRHLRPGGVLYVSYNVTPGWSPIVPLRHLLETHAARAGAQAAGILGRLDASLAFAEEVANAGALYFKAHPRVHDRLKKMQDKPRKYLAHELLNAEWHPMPFAQLVAELEEAKLSHAANATLLDQLDGLHLTAEGQTLVSGIEDLVLRETVRDFLTNNQFRRDYFVRGPRRLPGLVQGERLRAFRVVLGVPPSAITLEVRGALGSAKLQESVYLPVIEALAAEGCRPKSLGELERLAPGVSFAQLAQAITVLLGKYNLYLVQEEADIAAARPRARGLNLHLLDRARTSSEITFLASPVTGTGIAVSRTDQLFLLAHLEGKREPREWAESAWKVLSAQGQRLLKGGKRVEDEDENRRELTAQATELAESRLAVFERLGLV